MAMVCMGRTVWVEGLKTMEKQFNKNNLMKLLCNNFKEIESSYIGFRLSVNICQTDYPRDALGLCI